MSLLDKNIFSIAKFSSAFLLLSIQSLTLYASPTGPGSFASQKVEDVIVKSENGVPVAYIVLVGEAASNGCGFARLNFSNANAQQYAFNQDQYALILASISDGKSVSIDVNTSCSVTAMEVFSK